jgi:hypothetical protein
MLTRKADGRVIEENVKTEWHEELARSEELYVCSCGAIQWIGDKYEAITIKRFYSSLKEAYANAPVSTIAWFYEMFCEAHTDEFVEMHYGFWPDEECQRHLTNGSLRSSDGMELLIFTVPFNPAHHVYTDYC